MKLYDVTITSSLATVQAPYLTDFLRYQNAFRIDSWFYSGQLRALQHTGRISFIPNHLHLAGFKRNAAVKTNIFVCSASMPTEEGVMLSCSVITSYSIHYTKLYDRVRNIRAHFEDHDIRCFDHLHLIHVGAGEHDALLRSYNFV